MNKKPKSNKSISRVKKVTNPAKERENIIKGKSLGPVNLRKKKTKPALTKVSKKITKTKKFVKDDSKLVKTKDDSKLVKTKDNSKLVKTKDNSVSKKNVKKNKIFTPYKSESVFFKKNVNIDSPIKANLQSAAKKNVQKSGFFSEEQELPSHYGTTNLRLLVRDPFWIYAYWEISETSWKNLTKKLSSNEVEGAKTILRLYEVSLIDFNGKNANHYFDIDVGAYINNWHINLWSDNESYVGEIGIRTQSGDFFALSRSNCVHTPRVGYSPRTEQMWMKFIDETEHSRYIVARVKANKNNKGLGGTNSNYRYRKIIFLTEEDIKNYYEDWQPSLKDVLLKKDSDKQYEKYLLFLEGASEEEREKILSKLPKGYYIKSRQKGASEEMVLVAEEESSSGFFAGASEFASGNFIGASEFFIKDW